MTGQLSIEDWMPEACPSHWVPIKRGERGYSAGDFRCSKCGQPNHSWTLTRFCPSCGAEMGMARYMNPPEGGEG